jgi:hypothetical protein
MVVRAADGKLQPSASNAASSSSGVEEISADGAGVAVAFTSDSLQGVIAELENRPANGRAVILLPLPLSLFMEPLL